MKPQKIALISIASQQANGSSTSQGLSDTARWLKQQNPELKKNNSVVLMEHQTTLASSRDHNSRVASTIELLTAERPNIIVITGQNGSKHNLKALLRIIESSMTRDWRPQVMIVNATAYTAYRQIALQFPHTTFCTDEGVSAINKMYRLLAGIPEKKENQSKLCRCFKKLFGFLS